VNRLKVCAGYDIDKKLFSTTWTFKRNEETAEWILAGTSVKDIKQQDLRYNPEEAVIAALGRMSYSKFMFLEPETGWGTSPNPLPLLAKTFQALVNGDLQTLSSVTVSGALLRGDDKGMNIGQVIADLVPNREFDRQGTTDYLNEQVRHTAEIMNYCEAKVDDVMPYVKAYTVGSMPEHCNRVNLSVEFTSPDKHKGMTVGKRAMMGFTVEWSAVRLKDIWLVENMIVNCLVTDMAKSLYDK
jgi:hypothetical protein